MFRETMASYQAQNKRTITRAFRRLSTSEETVVKEGMCRVARAGMDFLLEAHTQGHYDLHHPEEKDTLAYVVAHDGRIIKAEGHDGGDSDLPGDALSKAKAIVSGSNGWVAIILSEMEGWYRVDWEMNFLRYSADHIRDHFADYFKRI